MVEGTNNESGNDDVMKTALIIIHYVFIYSFIHSFCRAGLGDFRWEEHIDGRYDPDE